MDITTKQELLDYIDSTSAAQEIKDRFHAMSDSEVVRFLMRVKTSDQVDMLLGTVF